MKKLFFLILLISIQSSAFATNTVENIHFTNINISTKSNINPSNDFFFADGSNFYFADGSNFTFAN